MASDSLPMLRRQLATAWALTRHHLDGLATAECLWRPAAKGLHVRQGAEGRWSADWPDHEGYDLGPPSLATLAREDVAWPGDADGIRSAIGEFHARWEAALEGVDLDTPSRWPFTDRGMADVIGWATIELTKNAAEIGYARFLYPVCET